MQIELIFIINISVLDFFKFASRMPLIAQILVSTFKIFWGGGGMPPDPPRNFLFFPWAIPGSVNMEFLQLSETTRAHEINVELKKNKWRNERLDPTRAWVAPGPLLDIFLFFSKTKIFHSHPCLCMCEHASAHIPTLHIYPHWTHTHTVHIPTLNTYPYCTHTHTHADLLMVGCIPCLM